MKCLLIDDDAEDREMFVEMVKGTFPSVEIEQAVNGREGLAKLLSTSGNPSLIFLDLNMPLMDGREFLVQIRKYRHLHHIPIYVLSTSPGAEIKNSMKFPVKGFITKPSTVTEWKMVLNTAIGPYT